MANPLGCAVAVAIFGILWGWLPFGVPCLWFWLAKLNDGAYRYFFAALWFWQMFAPSLLARDVHLDSIREWAGHGPMGLESTAPITGVFYPNGYPGLSVIDTSWCTWFAADKMLACPAGSPFTAWELGGSNLTAIAKKNSGFVPIGFMVTGTAIDKGFTAPTLPFHPFGGMPLYHPWMRNVMHFHFNEALNEAQVLENVCLLGTNLCITCHFMHSTVNMMMVKEGDGWIRNDYPVSHRNIFCTMPCLHGAPSCPHRACAGFIHRVCEKWLPQRARVDV